MDPLLTSMRALIERARMFAPGDTVLVAISGGQDSCALLHGLAALRNELGITLRAAHLNHGFRGAESDADANFAAALAESLGVPCLVERQDVPAQARRLHLSEEMAARRARHAFLERAAGSVGARRIALGHTQDDRVETILLNLLRGTGPDGLRGLAPVSGWRVRPLLEVPRLATEAYCHRHGIAFREDASNRSPRYTRNRLRSELLPEIESYYNPDARQALLRLSELVSEDTAYLTERAQEAFQRAVMNPGPDRVVISSRELGALPMVLRRRVVRMAIERVRGSLQDIDFAAVQRAMDGMARAAETGIPVQFSLAAGDARVRAETEALTVERLQAPRSYRRLAYALPEPGEAAVPEWGVRFRAAECAPPSVVPREAPVRRVWMDADRVRGPLTVRTWRSGDRIQPLGMAGTRKLQDLLTDRKVPAEERGTVPIIADGEGVIWVVGHALSERVKLGPETRRALLIEMTEL